MDVATKILFGESHDGREVSLVGLLELFLKGSVHKNIDSVVYSIQQRYLFPNGYSQGKPDWFILGYPYPGSRKSKAVGYRKIIFVATVTMIEI